MHPFCVFVIVFIASDLPIFISSAPRFQEGDIRLLGGRTRYEGTVLIYHNGEWGSICDRSWGRRDANVACRQLGYTRAMQSARGSRYGIGRNRRWMTRLRCRGSERRLDKCQFGEWGIRNDLRYCSARRRSAGVRCYPARMTRRRRPVTRAPRRRPVTSTPRPVTVRSTLKSTTITSTRPTTTPTTTTEKDKTTTNSGRRIVKTTKTPNEITKSIISSTRRPVTSTPRPVIVRSTLKPTTIPSTRPTPKYKITTENNKATTNIYRGMVQTIKTTPAEIINNIISSVVEAPAPQGPPVLTGSLADPDPPGSPGPPGQPGTNEDILNNNIPSPQQPYSFVSSSSSRSNTDVVQTLSPLSNHIQVLGTNSSNNGRREQNINTTLIHIAENNNIVVDLPETGTTPLTVSDTITPIPVETPDEKNDINNSPVQSLTTTENISPETELRESSSATSETMPSYLNITLSPSTSIRTTVSFLTTTSSPRKETTTEKTTPSTSNVNVNGQNPDLVQNKWIKDKLLNAFVFLSRRGKILVSKDGGRPEQMTIAQYINKRREVILSTLSDINDIQSDSHSNNEGSNTVNDDQDRISGDTESIVYIDTGNEESTSDDAISNVILTSREETQSNNDQSTRAITATQNPTKTTTISTTTTMTPTLTTTTTTTPTLTTPTTTTTPTPATTTTTTTTSATTTTTTATTTTSPTTITTTTRAPVMNRINDPYEGIRLVVNRWTRDNDLDKWVLLSRTGSILIADAGDSPTRITQQEYIQRRRYQLMSNSVYSTGSESESVMIRDEQGTNSDMAAARQPPTVVRNLGDSDSEINLQIDDPNAIGQQRGNRRHRNRHRHGNGQNGHRRQGKVGIRLMGGRHSLDGRVEVLPPGGGRWGVICADKWTMKEAIVACRHLRKSYAQQPIKMDHYGGSDQMKYYSSVECSGREKSLQDCKWREHDGPVTCSTPKSVAGVVCTRALPDLEPDIYMLETSVSLQDRHLYYLQCAMEEKCLAPSAYRVQGSRGWRHATRRLMRFSSVVKNIGTADFKPISDRSQWEWHACHMHYHSMEVFAHYDILDNNGNRVAEGLKASFCLEDSACNPGIYPKYSCQNYGQQGISVGCSDNYMSDIDCQWIDITDLKPGKYTFKLEINPNLYVAETSFENNVIVCDLTYTGYYARIFNCNLKSLL